MRYRALVGPGLAGLLLVAACGGSKHNATPTTTTFTGPGAATSTASEPGASPSPALAPTSTEEPTTTEPPTTTTVPVPNAPAAAQQGLQLAFHDEFDAPSLDGRRWVTCYWWGEGGCTIATNHEQEWYVPQQVSVRDGALHLQAARQTVTAPDGRRFPYVSGMVSTGRGTDDRSVPPGFAFQYGFVEARLRIPKGKALWPALWMLPITHDSLPEIDLLEVMGQDPSQLYMHLHYRTGRDERDQRGTYDGVDWSAGWHTIGLDWRPGRLVFFVDGQEVWRVEGRQVPAEPMYLLANLAVGGAWVGPIDDSTPSPATYQLDYIRIWSLSQ